MAVRRIRSALDLTKKQLHNLVLQVIAGDHGSPIEGSLWWDSTNGVKRPAVYDGATSRRLAYQGEGGGAGGTDADTLDGHDTPYFLDRTNHTGSQAAATISDFAAAVLGVAGNATDEDVASAIAALVDTSPAALDTLNELAAALGDDPNFATTINNALAARTRKHEQTFGDGVSLTYAITHNLGTRAVVVGVMDAATFEELECEVVRNSLNQVTLGFDAPAPAAGSLHVTVIG